MKYVFLILIFTFSSWSWSQNGSNNHSRLLWEITGNGLKKPSYLFGTIHLNNSELFQFQDSLYTVFKNVEIFSPEINIYDLFDAYTQPLNQHLLIDNSGKIYQSEKFIHSISYQKAMAWPQFLDAYLNQIAINSGKQIIALESVDEQRDIMNGITYYTTNYTNISDRDLIKSYQSGDILKIAQITHDALIGSNGFKEIIVNRNLKMVDKIDSLAHLGSTFIAVGAAHLGGNIGLVYLLQKKGYNLRVISSQTSATIQTDKAFFKNQHTSLFRDTTLGFQMKFGLYPFKKELDNGYLLESYELGQGNYYALEVQQVDSNDKVEYFLDENFYQPSNATLTKQTVYQKNTAYQGIIEIQGMGLAYRRIFIKDGYLFKITCSGNLPFLNSNRPNDFMNGMVFFD